MICPPDDAADPDMNMLIYECSNIKVLNLKFDGKIDTKEYPVYAAIRFLFSSGEASNNKIKGYHVGINGYDTNEELIMKDVKISHNNISDFNGQGLIFIGNFDVEVDHNKIHCSSTFDHYFINWHAIAIDGGTGTISKNNIKIKKSSGLPEYSVGIHLMKTNPNLRPLIDDLHDVDVTQSIIKGTDTGIKINSNEPFAAGWSVYGVRLLYTKFIQVGEPYEIYNNGVYIEIIPLP